MNLLERVKLPEASQMQNLDDPENIYALRKIIRRKPFLFRIYKEFYRDILRKIRTIPFDGEVIELGSGAGFLKSMAPFVITSDILPYEGIDRVFSALEMPMDSESVSAFVMIDVLHHIKDSRAFFTEVNRCLKVGGKIVMIEPANTLWSRFIYKNFHHEPFDITGGWGFEAGGPLSGANMAIPWIIFYRDRNTFAKEFPGLKVRSLHIHTPLRYLLSGGLSLRQLLPSWSYRFVRLTEWVISPFNSYLGLFMTIELEKVD